MDERKRRVECHLNTVKVVVQRKGGNESTERSRLVYITKSRGPRTTPWEHHGRRYTTRTNYNHICQ